MSFAFVSAREYSFGLEQLMAALKLRSVRSEVVFSKYDAMELMYLHNLVMAGKSDACQRACDLLAADCQRIVDRLNTLSPSVVGFSVSTDLYQIWLSVARAIKQDHPAWPIIMGGTHPTFLPERVIAQPCVDAVCLGEAERTIADIYDSLSGQDENVRVPGVWYKRNGAIIRNELPPLVTDLDQLPIPDMSPFVDAVPQAARSYQISASRGCPFSCGYCVAGAQRRAYRGLGTYLRRRSPGNVMAELLQARQKYHLEEVCFLDDVFTLDQVWLQEFLPRYKAEIGVPFRCLIHPSSTSEKILRLLKESGCSQVKVGIQHVNPVLCEKVFKRKLDLEQVRQTMKWLRALGIQVKADFIIGAPGETEQDLQNLVEFIKEIEPDDIFLYFLKYFPGTEVLDYARKHGVLTEEQAEAALEGMEIGYQYIPMRIQGPERELYAKYNQLIRKAAGSKFRVEQYDYLLAQD